MVNNTSKIERMEFFSKHTTNFSQTTPPKTTTKESYLKAMISKD
jgi:hypothetical protein